MEEEIKLLEELNETTGPRQADLEQQVSGYQGMLACLYFTRLFHFLKQQYRVDSKTSHGQRRLVECYILTGSQDLEYSSFRIFSAEVLTARVEDLKLDKVNYFSSQCVHERNS